MTIRWLHGVALCAALACLAPLASAAPPIPEIWFTPATWNIKPEGGLAYTEHDFPELLSPNAPWQHVAAHVAVLALPGNVVWSYHDLPGLIRFIDGHHLKLALSLGTMFGGGTCGVGIEGFSKDPDFNHEAVTIARLWHDAGGTLDYAMMDSPFYFGRYYAKDCHFDTAEIARRSGGTMRRVLEYFPNARVLDAEGPGAVADDTWLPDMKAWFPAFRAQAGHSIDSVLLDLHWHDLRPGNTWQDTTRRAVSTFSHLGIRTGLIVDAEGGPGVTDESWMQANREHIRDIAAGHFGLDYLLIDQWMHHVHRNLPETDPRAYTSLIGNLHDALRAAGPAR